MKAAGYLTAFGAAVAFTAFGAYLYSRIATAEAGQQEVALPPVQSVALVGAQAPSDFTDAAEMTVNGVVHVKVSQEVKSQGYSQQDFYDFFFGPQRRSQPRTETVQGAGSGVIISTDGYIVTNNHVIDGAQSIEVVLNDNRSFAATLIGADPTTDIALIKVDATDLPALAFANSDEIRVGQWVLAVGNPFNLTSTVTAGIVSATGRAVGINSSSMAIESFIQTDAAVNPGNSGGALVNTRGEVIGINTAIASTTGSYAGYSFAVPSNIARKVTEDLKAYGEVQRALLGVTIRPIDSNVMKEHNLSSTDGVLVVSVTDGGAAKTAGIAEGDVILAIDGEKVHTAPELQARVAQHRPGDAVRVTLQRNGKTLEMPVTLRNIRGTTTIVKTGDSSLLGAELVALTDTEMRATGLRYGLKVRRLEDGKLKAAGVREGYIITKANRMPVTSLADLQQIVASTTDGLFLAGVYADGRTAYYAVDLN